MLVQWFRTGYYDGALYLKLYWYHIFGAGRSLNRLPESALGSRTRGGNPD
jgi:hypothetical protein